jgi:dCTP deaminase
MLLSDSEIRKLCFVGEPMIEPFSEPTSGKGRISYGLTSAGYDLRLSPKGILVFKNSYGEVIDPKLFKEEAYRNRVFDELPEFPLGFAITIPAHGYVLGSSLEYLRIPRHLKGRCVGKSTLARSGIIINTTPLEPLWRGYLTIEIGNINPCPARVYVGEGIAQLEFELIEGKVETSYADKNGQYQNQMSTTPARVKE